MLYSYDAATGILTVKAEAMDVGVQIRAVAQVIPDPDFGLKIMDFATDTEIISRTAEAAGPVIFPRSEIETDEGYYYSYYYSKDQAQLGIDEDPDAYELGQNGKIYEYPLDTGEIAEAVDVFGYQTIYVVKQPKIMGIWYWEHNADGTNTILTQQILGDGKTSQSFTYGESVTFAESAPEKAGYTFKGWYTDYEYENAAPAGLAAGEYAFDVFNAVDGSINLFAKYTKDPVSIEGATVSGITDKGYTGGKQTQPNLKVVLDGNELNLNTEYTVEYVKNVSPGEATVIIKGMGAYTGEIQKTFLITQPGFIAYDYVEAVAGQKFVEDIDIECEDDTFGAIAKGTDVSSWFTYREDDKPLFQTYQAIIKDEVKEGDSKFTVTLSGTFADATDEEGHYMDIYMPANLLQKYSSIYEEGSSVEIGGVEYVYPTEGMYFDSDESSWSFEKGDVIDKNITIRLLGDTFKSEKLAVSQDISDWFYLPVWMKATITSVESDALQVNIHADYAYARENEQSISFDSKKVAEYVSSGMELDFLGSEIVYRIDGAQSRHMEGSVKGTVGCPLDSGIMIAIYTGETLQNMFVGMDATDWVLNLPSGLTASVAVVMPLSQESGITAVGLSVFGTPLEASNQMIQMKIPAECILTEGTAKDVRIEPSKYAVYDITTNAAILDGSVVQLTPGESADHQVLGTLNLVGDVTFAALKKGTEVPSEFVENLPEGLSVVIAEDVEEGAKSCKLELMGSTSTNGDYDIQFTLDSDFFMSKTDTDRIVSSASNVYIEVRNYKIVITEGELICNAGTNLGEGVDFTFEIQGDNSFLSMKAGDDIIEESIKTKSHRLQKRKSDSEVDEHIRRNWISDFPFEELEKNVYRSDCEIVYCKIRKSICESENKILL